MTLSSMTGFARTDGAHEGRQWVWEIKSVNSRGLEVRFRTPPGLDSLEPVLRKRVKDLFSRGAVNVHLGLKEDAGLARYKINPSALDETLRMIDEIRMRTDCEKPRAEGILNVRGVLEAEEAAEEEDAHAAFIAALTESFSEACAALLAARRAEGAALVQVIAGQFDEIERLAKQARANPCASIEAIRDRIAAQVSELLEDDAIAAERISQEAAMLAVKADIREELDRLDAHVEAGRSLLTGEAIAGRKLDFLTQELNREANTLCSKAQDMALKRTGLDLKTVIDQMREQVQNIE